MDSQSHNDDLHAAASFIPLLEKKLSSSILLSEWCTTMDIVVLVTEDGQLQLFRLNWERLWSKQPTSQITSLQWRPDGKELAYGDEDGNIYIVTAEDGSIVESRKAFPKGKVVALSWVVNNHVYASKAHVGATIGYRAPQLLYSNKIDEELRSGSDVPEYIHAGVLQGHDRPKPMCHTMCAINSAGDGILCGEGLLPLATFKINQIKEENPSVSLRMSSDADNMWISWVNTMDILCVSRMDTSVIQRHASMIHTLGCLLSDTLKDINMAYDIMRNIQKEISAVDSSREDHLGEMRITLGGLREPEKDVYDFLIRGHYSIELRNFVAKEIKLKETARSIDACMSRVYSNIVSYLQPCLERIAFRLGDIRGFSLVPEGEEILGLNAFETSKCERRILNLASLCEHVRELVLKISSGYRNLFSLFSMLQHRDAGEPYPHPPKSSIDEIVRFITSGYYVDEIHTILDAMLGPDGKEDEELLAKIFQVQCEMKETKKPSQDLKDQSDVAGDEAALENFMSGLERWLDGKSSIQEVDILVQESSEESTPHGIYGLDYFKALFLSIISRPPKTLSSLIKTTHHWSLFSGIQSDDSFSMSFDDQEDIHLLFASRSNSSFCRVHIDRKIETIQIQGGHISEDQNIISCDLYKSECILVTSVTAQGSLMCMIPAQLCHSVHSESLTCKGGSVEETTWAFLRKQKLNLNECRTRFIPKLQIGNPFALSVTRGVALAVYLPQNSVTVFDLEEDEEQDEYEEE